MNGLFENQLQYIASPLNYTGSKLKLLPQLIPLFPKTTTIVDAFCGGGSISFNTNYEITIANDIITPLVEFYSFLQTNSWETILSFINARQLGYDKNNQNHYSALRDRFNSEKNCIDFFLLVCSCTNNMLRFNKKFEFNQTWGKRAYNPKTEEKLYGYWKRLQSKKIIFSNKSFDLVTIPEDAFVYLDPPYMITEAGYNSYWGKDKEAQLYDFIDSLNEKGIKFALSNVALHKGRENPYMHRLKQYNISELKFEYDKVSRTDETSVSKEISVRNF